MKIFLSWSGERSRLAARPFKEFLSLVLQDVQVYHIDDETRLGVDWVSKVRAALERVDVTIGLLTVENLNSPWLTFEAGACWSRNITYLPLLINISPVDLVGPFAQFQGSTTSREDLYRLILVLNRKLEHPLTDDRIKMLFQHFWPGLSDQLSSLQSVPLIPMLDEAPFWRAQNAVTSSAPSNELVKRIEEVEQQIARLLREKGGA